MNKPMFHIGDAVRLRGTRYSGLQGTITGVEYQEQLSEMSWRYRVALWNTDAHLVCKQDEVERVEVGSGTPA